MLEALQASALHGFQQSTVATRTIFREPLQALRAGYHARSKRRDKIPDGASDAGPCAGQRRAHRHVSKRGPIATGALHATSTARRTGSRYRRTAGMPIVRLT